ncbi:MAG: hypothetical protein R3F07_12065 [Opitutaceae bacterium]
MKKKAKKTKVTTTKRVGGNEVKPLPGTFSSPHFWYSPFFAEGVQAIIKEMLDLPPRLLWAAFWIAAMKHSGAVPNVLTARYQDDEDVIRGIDNTWYVRLAAAIAQSCDPRILSAQRQPDRMLIIRVAGQVWWEAAMVGLRDFYLNHRTAKRGRGSDYELQPHVIAAMKRSIAITGEADFLRRLENPSRISADLEDILRLSDQVRAYHVGEIRPRARLPVTYEILLERFMENLPKDCVYRTTPKTFGKLYRGIATDMEGIWICWYPTLRFAGMSEPTTGRNEKLHLAFTRDTDGKLNEVLFDATVPDVIYDGFPEPPKPGELVALVQRQTSK